MVGWEVSPQRFERRSRFGSEVFRLFPHREVTALLDLIPIDELVIGTLDPASWRTVDLAGKTVTLGYC